MIEVNLLPGAPKRSKRRGLPRVSLPLPAISGLPRLDRMTAGLVVAWIVGPLAAGGLFMSDRSKLAELDAAIQLAVDDSTRYAELIAASAKLQARRDSIAQKLQVIQELDATRFVWAHLLDEVSGALPEYTWLQKIVELDDGGPGEVAFEIQGQTGNNFALTRFMTQLEASPFIQGVKMTSMDLEQATANSQELVYEFILQATYEAPPVEVLQTVPIFGEQD